MNEPAAPVDFNLPFPEAIEKVEINFFSTFDLTSNGFTRCSIDTRNPLNQSSQNRQRFRTLLKGQRSLKKSFLVTQGRVMAPLVARLAMRNPLIARLSKSGNGYAHYFKATEKVKTKLFQWPQKPTFFSALPSCRSRPSRPVRFVER
ncbi:hypothetical protein [Halalkalibacter sp. APA_J-10(15)]|uniref:hypothetical protein n=1 Tax=Halalkalibacter sp. APA_J-10(15) TaxID=2933805 RepID=UPI001FF50C92|nr:hypothetical protein [Halalkalibacter sp. APA_J-10(15)]MCK0470009.1 hypothetical protein [Halalkalibacter sp. APA_J-10(15)]